MVPYFYFLVNKEYFFWSGAKMGSKAPYILNHWILSNIFLFSVSRPLDSVFTIEINAILIEQYNKHGRTPT